LAGLFSFVLSYLAFDIFFSKVVPEDIGKDTAQRGRDYALFLFGIVGASIVSLIVSQNINVVVVPVSSIPKRIIAAFLVSGLTVLLGLIDFWYNYPTSELVDLPAGG